jgi:signal transduction histidine kinase
MLHDARNLMGALGLYCDLLSMPGVLKPEHSHYPEELRLLGSRSQALIEHLMQSLLAQGQADGVCLAMVDKADDPGSPSPVHASLESKSALKPVSLRGVVERCSGLLSQVSDGRVIEVTYGEAATEPVLVAEEAVERILVNLVRNAAAASAEHPGVERSCPGGASGSAREICGDSIEGKAPGAIRIGVGMLVNRVGDSKPWPIRRVRLTVEDSGCGMTAKSLERLLCGKRAPSRGSHGIGFRVVRELVAVSNGDLRVLSELGTGTRVQIEWDCADEKESGCSC